MYIMISDHLTILRGPGWGIVPTHPKCWRVPVSYDSFPTSTCWNEGAAANCSSLMLIWQIDANWGLILLVHRCKMLDPVSPTI